MASRPCEFRQIAQVKNQSTYAGMGAVPSRADKSRFVGALQSQLKMPPNNMPTVAGVTINYPGPLTPSDAAASFGAVLDPLTVNRNTPPAGAASVEVSGGIKAGSFQVPTLITAIGIHLSPDPQVWTCLGNAIPTPNTGIAKPISPDVFTAADRFSSGSPATQQMFPAILQWAWWQEQAFYHLCRAFVTKWYYGSNATIMNDSVQYTAYTPGNAQNGSSSSSQIDPFFAARKTNDFYRQIGSPYIFTTEDRTRQAAAGTLCTSLFRPERDTDLVDVTYGGAGLRSLLNGNHAFRRLSVPWLMYPGVQVGLQLEQIDQDEGDLMRSYLSTSYGLGGATGPASFTEDANIINGFGADASEQSTGAESCLESTWSGRMIFKGAPFKFGIILKGLELNDQQAAALKDVDIATVVQNETGLIMM